MNIFARIFYTFFFIAFGYIILRYRKQIKGWVGGFVWAEQYIGRGGTYLVLILIGIAMVIFGVVIPFGTVDFLFGAK